MKRNLIMLAILVLFGASSWGYQNWIYGEYPAKIRQLDRTIAVQDEKLISAQIIHQQLDLVAKLIERNLATSKNDSLASDASLPFMEFITGVLDDLDMKLVKLQPGRRSTRLDYVRVPYSMVIESSYTKLGKFINELEKSERLITVEQFEIDNAVRKSGAMAEKSKDLSTKVIDLKISTLALIKQR